MMVTEGLVLNYRRRGGAGGMSTVLYEDENGK